MKTRDFLRLPVGAIVDLTDGIYNYRLRKVLTDEGKPMYSVRELQGWGHFALFEKTEPVYEDSKLPVRRVLFGCTSVGSISFHDDSVNYRLLKLKVVAKSTYVKSFIENELTVTENS